MLAASLAVLAAASLTAVAGAAVLAPPGKSGANQYFEDIPSSQGNAAPPGTGGPSSPASVLGSIGRGRAGARSLAKLGKDGQAAAVLATETAPSSGAQARSSARHAGGASTRAGVSTRAGGPGALEPLIPSSGGSSTGALVRALGGSSGGLGLLFPVLLVAGLLAAAVGAGARLMRRGPGPTGRSA